MGKKIEIEDDCFAPRRYIFINYSGPDPFAFARLERKLLRPIFEVSSSKIGEPRWMWDWTGDPIQFYLHWIIKKPMSRFTTFWYSIRVVGFKYKTKNEGKFRMEIEAVARHKFEADSKLKRLFFWIYWYLFYARIRQRQLELCKEYAERFINKIKEMYKIGKIGEE